MTYSRIAVGAVAAGPAAGWNSRAIVPSSSAKPGKKLVVSRLIFIPYSIAFSSSPLASPFGVSRRSIKCVGLQTIACSSSLVNQIAKDNVQDVSGTSDSVAKEDEEAAASKNAEEPTPDAPISSFMAHIAELIKLVDSRDIVELEMKHKDFEIVIRKKEALAHTPPPAGSSPGPHVMAHTSYPEYIAPSAPSAPAISTPPPLPPASSPSSKYPPVLSPMAGTFYRSSGPAEPPFVQVGDKITKGQVVCIVEAMKLMNEIEADRSGTIVEIVAEDGKPVAIDSPLYVIKP